MERSRKPLAILIFLLITFCVFRLQAQEISLDSIKTRLATDSLAYVHFQNLGWCRCMDNLLENRLESKHVEDDYKLYRRYYEDISGAYFALVSLIDFEVLTQGLDTYYKEQLEKTVLHLREYNDEYFNSYRSSFYICETMYLHNESARKAYMDLINDEQGNARTFKYYSNKKHFDRLRFSK